MTMTSPPLQRAIDAMSVPGILVGHRVIADGDERALLPEERDAFAGSVIKVQRASGAARIVARGLMQGFGHAQTAIRKSTAGMPVWPAAVVGSLAHEATIAVAAVASRDRFASVGVDIEPAGPLDADLLDIVATERERQSIERDPLRGRVLFSVKEAVYKAVYPLDRMFLDHHDVEVDLPNGLAVVRRGRAVPFRFCVASHIVALAFIPAEAAAR